MISPFIDPVTRQKIVFLSTDPSEMIEAVNRDIDVSILEADIGGGDPRPFDSALYLQGEFSLDFLSIINSKTALSSASTAPIAVKKTSSQMEQTSIQESTTSVFKNSTSVTSSDKEARKSNAPVRTINPAMLQSCLKKPF